MRVVVQFTMVLTAERHREFVADLGAERRPLGKADVMSIGRLSAADCARLRPDKLQMLLVAEPARLAEREHAFVYPRCPKVGPLKRGFPHAAPSVLW